jgi:hypothetical protein
MGRFEVTPGELEAAAGTLGSVGAELGCPTLAPGDLGSPELEAALGQLYAATNRVAGAMSEAVSQASTNTAAGAGAYVGADVGAMPGGR